MSSTQNLRHHAAAFIILVLILLSLSHPSQIGMAQETAGAVYIVQEGDSLWEIAVRFRVSVEDLSLTNDITNPSQLAVGARLIIPGLEGINGVLTTRPVGYGDTLRSL